MKQGLKKGPRIHAVKTASQLLSDQSEKVLKGIPTQIFNEWFMKQGRKKGIH